MLSNSVEQDDNSDNDDNDDNGNNDDNGDNNDNGDNDNNDNNVDSEGDMDKDDSSVCSDGIFQGASFKKWSFDSFTMSMLSVFLHTSNLSRRHFTALLQILCHRQFKVNNLPKSYIDARHALSNVPTLPLHVHYLPVNKWKGSGRSNEEVKPVYTHSLSDLLHRALSAPSLMP